MNHKHYRISLLAALLLIGAAGCDQLASVPQALPAIKPTPAAGAPTNPSAAPPAAAPARRPPAVTDERAGRVATSQAAPFSVRDVVERVKPAVVQIVTEQAGQRTDPLSGSTSRQRGIGSGVIFDSAGRILTNHHVVAGARSMTVALPDGRTFDARLVGVDPDTDLAVIQIQGDNLPAAPLGDSDQLAVGDGLVAIGNALGLPGGPTVTTGVVSALGRTVQEPSGEDDEPGAVLYDAIQTDAAINPGNSGGPLVNMYGEVIGMNTMIVGMAERGVPAQGIGFAIAINTAKPIADQIVATGRAVHPYLGIAYQWLGGASARQRQADGKQGVVVQRVASDSPAARAGMQRGDLITSINGQPLGEEAAVAKAIQKQRPGDTIQLTIQRDDQERTLSVTLGERPRS